MRCRAAVPDLGAYVLGALAPEEQRAVREHLRRCADCRAELAELSALPGLLALVDPEDLRTPPVAPSPDLFGRVSAAAAGPARRRRRLLAVAAALVLALGGVAAGIAVWPGGGGTTTVSASAGAVRFTVTASPGGGGTVLDVAVAGLAREERCRLVVVDGDGRRHPAGEWPVDEDGGGTWRGWADVDAGDLASVVLLDGDGAPLLRAPL